MDNSAQNVDNKKSTGPVALSTSLSNQLKIGSTSTTFSYPSAILHVKILSGTNLYQTDAFHPIDPYVQVSLGSDSSRSITLLRGGSNCVFNWKVAFPINPDKVQQQHRDGLAITVWDQDLGSKDDEVGRATIPTAKFLKWEKSKSRAFEGKVKLEHKGRLTGRSKDGGSLDVEIYWETNSVFTEARDVSLENMVASPAFGSGGSAAVPIPIPLTYCVTNFNNLSGLAQTIIDRKKISEYTPFRTYRMRLWHVPFVFRGFTKGWNRQYKAAQQIYGTHLGSKTVRATLRMQNYVAYSNDYVNNRSSEVHELSAMESFRRMLRSYDGRDVSSSSSFVPLRGKVTSPRYTYVIMPDSHMHFSVTSTKIATDFLSKHALHAGAATEVVYSGEFFFDRFSRRAVKTGKAALVIDNNSGTFAPPKDKLESLKLLMYLNFGTKVPVFAFDRDDPLLKELSDANGVE